MGGRLQSWKEDVSGTWVHDVKLKESIKTWEKNKKIK